MPRRRKESPAPVPCLASSFPPNAKTAPRLTYLRVSCGFRASLHSSACGRLLNAPVSVRPQQRRPVCGAACADGLPWQMIRFRDDPPAGRTGAAGSLTSLETFRAAMTAENRTPPGEALTSCRLLMPAVRSQVGRHANAFAHEQTPVRLQVSLPLGVLLDALVS